MDSERKYLTFVPTLSLVFGPEKIFMLAAIFPWVNQKAVKESASTYKVLYNPSLS